MIISKDLKDEILQEYHLLWEANLTANMEKFAAYMVDDFSIFGSAKGETFSDKQSALNFYASTAEELRDKAQLRNRDISIQPILGNAFVIKEQSDLYVLIGGKWTFYGHARISCIMRKIDDEWKVLHQHASFPDHRTEEGQQLAAEKIEKENLELKEAVHRRTVELAAKNRELEIEAALERVRSRSLAMRESNELADVVMVLFERMKELHIPATAVGIALKIDGSGDLNNYVCGEGESGLIITNYRLPYFDNLISKDLNKGFNQQSDVFVGNYSTDEKDSFYTYLLKHVAEFSKIPADVKQMIFNSSAYTITMVAVKNALFTINDFEGKCLSPAELDIIKRFAIVFEQSYTRFLDLQKAEAQSLQIRQEKERLELTLTNLRATQSQLIQAEKMASLGELTAGIAHEIQNPLNFVNNFSEVSKELLDEIKEAIESGDTEDAKEIMADLIQNLEKINHHGKRADAIVKGMLQHSRASSAVKEPTNLNALTDEYLRLSYHGLRAKDKTYNAILQTDFDKSIGCINIIPQDMGRVILNLLTNAFYAVDEKKKVVGSSTGYEPAVSVSTKKFVDKVQIKISDNGNGIPKNVLDKIFQPFFTTKPTGQGTGLGLSLAYDIIKVHGGEIVVNTSEGKGTEFLIVLPVR